MMTQAPFAREWRDVAPFQVDDVLELHQWRNVNGALELTRHNLAGAAVAAAGAAQRAEGLGSEQALSAVLAERRRGLEPGSIALYVPRLVERLELLRALTGQVEANLAVLERRSAHWYSMLPRALRCRGNPARPLASHLTLATARHAARQGQSPDRLEV